MPGTKPGLRLTAHILICTVVGYAAALPAAEFYRWRDSNGVLHYSDLPPTEGNYESGSLSEAGTVRVAPVPRFKPARPAPRKRSRSSAKPSGRADICGKLKARTGQLRLRLREGYEAAAGEKLKAELRRLRKHIFREC